MSVRFRDLSATDARPISLDGTFPVFRRTTLLLAFLGVDYQAAEKTLVLQGHHNGCRLDLQGIDCTMLEQELIAANLLRPIERGGYRKFTPRRPLGNGFYTGSPGTRMRAQMVKVTVPVGEAIALPADAYLGIFLTARKRPEHQMVRLRALVGGDHRDTFVDIVVFASDLMLALTQVGFFHAIGEHEGDCIVSLSTRRLDVPRPAAAMVG